MSSKEIDMIQGNPPTEIPPRRVFVVTVCDPATNVAADTALEAHIVAAIEGVLHFYEYVSEGVAGTFLCCRHLFAPGYWLKVREEVVLGGATRMVN